MFLCEEKDDFHLQHEATREEKRFRKERLMWR